MARYSLSERAPSRCTRERKLWSMPRISTARRMALPVSVHSAGAGLLPFFCPVWAISSHASTTRQLGRSSSRRGRHWRNWSNPRAGSCMGPQNVIISWLAHPQGSVHTAASSSLFSSHGTKKRVLMPLGTTFTSRCKAGGYCARCHSDVVTARWHSPSALYSHRLLTRNGAKSAGGLGVPLVKKQWLSPLL